jgi:hypothetical protein
MVAVRPWRLLASLPVVVVLLLLGGWSNIRRAVGVWGGDGMALRGWHGWCLLGWCAGVQAGCGCWFSVLAGRGGIDETLD